MPGDPAQATPTDLEEADSILRRVRCPELYPGAREVVDRVHSSTALSLSLILFHFYQYIHLDCGDVGGDMNVRSEDVM